MGEIMDTRFPATPQPTLVPAAVREDSGATPALLNNAVHQADAGKPVPAGESALQQQGLDKAVAEVNSFLLQQDRTLQFSVDRDSGRTVVKVVDTATGDLIRQIPSEDWLRLVHAMRAKPGSLLHDEA